MTTGDADALLDIMHAAWGAGDRPPGLLRIRHLVGTDPGGAWVTTAPDGTVEGGALALVREGVWGLSLLIVRAERQSAGQGRALMDAALAYAPEARGGIIMASGDHRALRTYWRAGFALHPTLDARGTVRERPAADPAVREARWPEDRDLVDAAGRAVRGAAHGPDVDAMIGAGATLLVHDDGGFGAFTDKGVKIVAASDERVAVALLRTMLAGLETADVSFIDARQQWALNVVARAGLELVPNGAVCVRGDLGPMRPYLPSGAFL